MPAGAAAAALVAASAVGVTALNGHSTGGGGPVAPAHPGLLTTDYVVAHVKAALNANTAVLVTVSHAPNSQNGRPVIFESRDSSLSNTSRSEILNRHGQPEVPRGFRTVHPLGWTSGKVK